MKSDVPSGEERLTREINSLLSGILDVRRRSLEASILIYKSFQSACIDSLTVIMGELGGLRGPTKPLE
jgi:hypothetical protein